MDFAKQQAITACGTCGFQEDDHPTAVGVTGRLDVLIEPGRPCGHYRVPPAAMAYAQHLAIANGPGEKQGPPCPRCTNRGHRKEDCVL